MKKNGLIKLICSLIAVAVVAITVILILIFSGVIRFEKTNITLSSASSAKTYDGKELRDSGWKLDDGKLHEGHWLDVSVSGCQSSVGISENYISAVVRDENGADVSGEYNIIYKPGALSIKARSITLVADSDMKAYDGEPLVAGGYKVESPISLLSDNRLDVKVEGSITEIGNTDSLITKVVIFNARGQDVTRNYNVKTVNGKLIVYSSDSIVIETADDQKVYDGSPLKNNNWSLASGKIPEGCEIFVEVTGSILNVGTVDNEFSVVIKDASGNDVTSRYPVVKKCGKLTVQKRSLTIKSESESKTYDGIPLTNDGVSFILNPKLPELDKNFIFDATVTGSITNIGETPNTIASYKILNMRYEDISSNFEIDVKPGTLKIFPKDEELPTKLKIETGDKAKIYDGKPLTHPSWELVSGELKPGHSLDVTVTGSITSVGTAENEATVVIRDGAGNDVTELYEIQTLFGILEVKKANVTIESSTNEKVYDGAPLTDSGFSVDLGNLLDDFKFDVQVLGSRTEIGESSNTLGSYSVTNKLTGEDVTKNFNITKKEGTLRVVEKEEDLKPVLVYKTGSAFKTYDGTPLENPEYKRKSGELLPGHREVVEMNSSITNAGAVPNKITVTILDENDVDVTDQYIIKCENEDVGTLTVNKKEINITADSATWTYDGDEHSFDSFTLGDTGELVDGERLEVETTGSQLNVGSSKNTVNSVEIFDSEGNDVSDNYDIKTKDGTLTVKPIEITIAPESLEKKYDGTGLTAEDIVIEPADALLNGHKINAEVSGSISEDVREGTAISEILSYEIVDENGNDVSGNYTVTVGTGLLSIMKSDDSFIGAPTDFGEEITYFIVKDTVSDTIYLKTQSYSDYMETKNGWKKAPVYEALLHSGESAFFLTSYALENSGLSKGAVTITPMAGVFALPYYSVGNIVNSSTDAEIIGGTYGKYTLEYYNWDATAGISVPSKYAEEELLYREYVKNTYLQIDDETLAFMNGIIASENFRASDYDIISKVADYIKRSAKYDLDYNRALDKESNVAVAFLSKYKTGICQHYATAATLMFRALGIPARYTVGFAAPVTANKEAEVTSKMAHAWVEVYVDEIGWINVEVTGEGNAATGGDKPKSFTVTPSSTDAVYYGQTLYPSQTVSGLDSLIKDGYRYEATVSGSNSELGITSSEVTSLRIYDSFNDLVYDKETGLGADKFKITYKPGNIHLYISEITFTSPSKTKEYDGYGGEPLTFTESECYISWGMLDDGYSYVITSITELYDAKQTASKFKVEIYKDGVSCNEHYKINYDYGILTVTKKNLDLTAGSLTVAYDGNAHTTDEIIYDPSELAFGDYIAEKDVFGSQTNIGKASNVIRSVTIRNADGKDVTENYLITIYDGLITVTRP